MPTSRAVSVLLLSAVRARRLQALHCWHGEAEQRLLQEMEIYCSGGIMTRRIFPIGGIFLLVGSVFLPAAPKKIQLHEQPGQVNVSIEGKPFTTYLFGSDPAHPLKAVGVRQTKPVLVPVYSPSGTMVTRAYPFWEVAGETKDHPHHMGIWFAVDRVGGDDNDFWGNSQNALPAILHQRIMKMKGGNGTGELDVLSHWVGKKGVALLEELREMHFLAMEANQYAIDFTIHLKPLVDEIAFGDTKEGMFAIRVAEWLTESETGRYLNSNEEKKEEGVWGKRANWVRLQGEKEGKKIGILILSHPSSVNSPTYWHARGYGCFSVNPLGQLDFEKTHKLPDPQPFNLRLKLGEQALFRYRVIIYEGDYNSERIEKLYQEFTQP